MSVTLREWLDEFAAQHGQVEAIVIGDPPDYRREWPTDVRLNVVISVDEAASILGVRFDDGFGGQECPSVWAWSESHVFLIGTYDGSTWWEAIPRSPADGAPSSVGGG